MGKRVVVVFGLFSLFFCACSTYSDGDGKHWHIDWVQTQESVDKSQAFAEMMAEETGSSIFAGIAGALATLSGALGYLARKQRKENKHLRGRLDSTVGVAKEALDAYKQGEFFAKCNEIEEKLQTEIDEHAKGV